jgi:U1 small nuclear ribonucleoprotein
MCIVALDRANGRKVDGRRVVVDYERGRTKQEWIPRRLGGGKGEKRRDRETERMIRELKKSDPLLAERSRSRSPGGNQRNEAPIDLGLVKSE